jgi:CRP-like cAMP-binding protein
MVFAAVAQLVEQRTENPRVGGSIPPRGTKEARFTLRGKPGFSFVTPGDFCPGRELIIEHESLPALSAGFLKVKFPSIHLAAAWDRQQWQGVMALTGGCGCGHQDGHSLCVSRVPIFAGLETGQLVEIASLIRQRTYRRGEFIAQEGSQPEGLNIVHSGRVKVFNYTPEGREQILYVFSTGDFFGEMNLLGQEPLRYSVEALEPTRICQIRRDDFRQLVRKNPDILLKVAEELSLRLGKMEDLVLAMGGLDAKTRVIMMLLEFSRKYGQKQAAGKLVTLPLGREGLANYVGVARETISRKLHQLQDEGYIKLLAGREVLILDEEGLEREQNKGL